MTTTSYPFTGDELKSITFTPTLDGAVYSAQITWNLASQRWYITITGNDGTRYLTRPLVGSVDGADINVVFGVFTSTTLIWRIDSGVIEVTT